MADNAVAGEHEHRRRGSALGPSRCLLPPPILLTVLRMGIVTPPIKILKILNVQSIKVFLESPPDQR